MEKHHALKCVKKRKVKYLHLYETTRNSGQAVATDSVKKKNFNKCIDKSYTSHHFHPPQ